MKKALIVFSLLLIGISCKNKQEMPVSDNFEVYELADGVYALIHKLGGKAISNAGIVDLGDTTLVFDTFLSPLVAQEIPAVVSKLGLSPVKYVVDSHWHNDHIRGNQIFANDVKIISSKRTTELIEENAPQHLAYEKEHAPARFAYYDSLLKAYTGDKNDREYQKILMWQPYYQVLAEENAMIKTRLPNTFINKEKTIHGRQRTAKLFARGAGHTESDIILYLPQDKIVFSGDVVFKGRHPYLPDGNTDKLREWLSFIEKLDVRVVVPGHGPLGDLKDVGIMRDYLYTLDEIAAQLIKENKPVTEAQLPKPFNQWWFERFVGWNLEFLMDNLKEKQ
jgi:cyclase